MPQEPVARAVADCLEEHLEEYLEATGLAFHRYPGEADTRHHHGVSARFSNEASEILLNTAAGPTFTLLLFDTIDRHLVIELLAAAEREQTLLNDDPWA